MKGTALLMNKDQTVTILENVEHSVYEELSNEEKLTNPHCTINNKEVTFDPISTVVWHEDVIDWEYGY